MGSARPNVSLLLKKERNIGPNRGLPMAARYRLLLSAERIRPYGPCRPTPVWRGCLRTCREAISAARRFHRMEIGLCTIPTNPAHLLSTRSHSRSARRNELRKIPTLTRFGRLARANFSTRILAENYWQDRPQRRTA